MRFDVESAVTTRGTDGVGARASGPLASGLDFLQLRGTYTVTGHARSTHDQLHCTGKRGNIQGQSADARRRRSRPRTLKRAL